MTFPYVARSARTPKHGLRAARVDAEAADDLVEDERRPVCGRELPHRVQELPRLEVGVPALDRLDEHRREIRHLGLERVQRLVGPVVEDEEVLDLLLGDAGRDREGRGCPFGPARADEHLVERSMVRAREESDLLPARHGPRETHGRHHRLGARVAERRALHPRERADELSGASGVRRLRPDLHALAELRDDGLRHEGGGVPEHVQPESHEHVDVFVSVDVPEPGPRRAHGDERVDDLLPEQLESGGDAGIGERRARRVREALGARRLRRVPPREIRERAVLALREAASRSRRDRLVGTERLEFLLLRGGGVGRGGRRRAETRARPARLPGRPPGRWARFPGEAARRSRRRGRTASRSRRGADGTRCGRRTPSAGPG